jgi:MFS family permease
MILQNSIENIAVRNTKFYYISQFLHSLILIAPIWIVFQQSKGLSPAEISSLVTVMYLSQMLFEVPSGAIADLLGRRNTLIFSFILGAAAYLWFPFFQGYWQAFLAVILMGVSDSFRSGSEEALIYDSFKQEKNETGIKKIFAQGNFIYQIGLILSAIISGYLYTANHTYPFLGYATILSLGVITVACYREPLIDSEKFSWKGYVLQMKHGIKEIFKSQKIKNLSFFYIIIGGVAWSSTLYFNEYLMVDLGFTDQFRGVLSGSLRLLNVLLISKLLLNEKLFDYQRTILFFPIIMMISYLPGALLQGYWGIPFIQGAMIATTARWIVLAPLVNASFDSKYRATAISVLSLLIGVVYVSLTTLSMAVIPLFGMKVMYSLLGIVTLFAAFPLARRLLKQ